jgi:hypothetical protein
LGKVGDHIEKVKQRTKDFEPSLQTNQSIFFKNLFQNLLLQLDLVQTLILEAHFLTLNSQMNPNISFQKIIVLLARPKTSSSLRVSLVRILQML